METTSNSRDDVSVVPELSTHIDGKALPRDEKGRNFSVSFHNSTKNTAGETILQLNFNSHFLRFDFLEGEVVILVAVGANDVLARLDCKFRIFRENSAIDVNIRIVALLEAVDTRIALERERRGPYTVTSFFRLDIKETGLGKVMRQAKREIVNNPLPE